MISLRLPSGRIVDLHGRLVEIGRDATGKRWAMWEERLESVVRKVWLDPRGKEQSEPSSCETHSAVLYEVEPDVWSYPHRTGWPSFLPEPELEPST